MTGTVILSDQGQSYVEFTIVDDLIQSVRPSGADGWINTKVRNLAFMVGGRLVIELHNGYRMPLRYPIIEIR